MSAVEMILLLAAWFVAGASPGPATLAISGTAMAEGRRAGLTIASGVLCGSAFWGVAAALGMSALMLAHVWLFELVRYAGAIYLLWLAAKALRRAINPPSALGQGAGRVLRRLFVRGLLIHITNPKAILSWGAIYAIALPAGADMVAVWHLFAKLICVSGFVFLGYGMLFSIPGVARVYMRLRRGFDTMFAILFGGAALKLLTTRLEV
ncbi:LysE family transporter [Roseovarius aestuarii]|nr:LysE family transporter [Roseovarius aestuarii]